MIRELGRTEGDGRVVGGGGGHDSYIWLERRFVEYLYGLSGKWRLVVLSPGMLQDVV